MTSIEERLKHYYDREMAQRAERPLGEERESRLADFVLLCRDRGLRSVVEVGCGAGRDGKVLAAAGLAYKGIDLSAASVDLCRTLGLEAVAGSAQELPYADDEFDAGWSMSTLMHLPGEGLRVALGELHRVIRPGGVLEVGLWGADESGEWTDADGRYFRSRTDDELCTLLSDVGEVTHVDTWSRFDDGGHYQWARVVVD
ncbi:class I SAM-dependent methyltransferase [Humibacillus xanthopallidus]|uniref:class I SAM-dependent methyltransferase n=1 Tax=Humibacillus xanthopallidus TaxID=412689 RepID=UPI00384A6888